MIEPITFTSTLLHIIYSFCKANTYPIDSTQKCKFYFLRMKVEELLRQNENKDNGISVPDNWEETSYDAKLFAIPEHYKPYIDKVMLPRGLVMDRTEKMG